MVMESRKNPSETLAEIRSLMERSSRFISLSGLSGVAAGLFAIIGAALVYIYLDITPFDGRRLYYVEAVHSTKWGMNYITFFLLDIAFVLIGAIYFFIANLPLPALAGLFARIHVAIFIWSQFSDNIISISSIPFLLWIFNSLIPALVGSVFVMNLNIAKNFRYER